MKRLLTICEDLRATQIMCVRGTEEEEGNEQESQKEQFFYSA